jgi:[ribosomal protein S5]-alanine N-acetyltransferase
MLKPIHFESDKLLVHPFRQIDSERNDTLAEDIYNILSDEQVLTFIPEKRLSNIEEAKNYVYGVVIGYHQSTAFTFFITIKEINRTIGIIKLIPPSVIKVSYKLNEYNWMIEYCLLRSAWRRNIMSEILPAFIARVFSQGIVKLGAACFPTNYGSVKLLQKTGFIKKYKFDDIQDYYEIVYNA